MRKKAGPILLFLLLFITGCTPAATTIWKSTPEVQTSGTEVYEAHLEPVTTGKGPFFDSFRLIITNKKDRDLLIDWNRTRYVESGKRHGGFVWEGIDPDQVGDASVPPDIVPPGSTFSRVIFPHKKLAYAPGYQTGQKISGGLIPEGENGIDLVVKLDGKTFRHRITVRISEE